MDQLAINNARMIEMLASNTTKMLSMMPMTDAQALWVRFPDAARDAIPEPGRVPFNETVILPGNKAKQGMSKLHENAGLFGGRKRRQTKRQRSQRQK